MSEKIANEREPRRLHGRIRDGSETFARWRAFNAKPKAKSPKRPFSARISPWVRARICSAQKAQAAAHDTNTPASSGMLKGNVRLPDLRKQSWESITMLGSCLGIRQVLTLASHRLNRRSHIERNLKRTVRKHRAIGWRSSPDTPNIEGERDEIQRRNQPVHHQIAFLR